MSHPNIINNYIHVPSAWHIMVATFALLLADMDGHRCLDIFDLVTTYSCLVI